MDTSPLYSTETEYCTPTSKHVMEQDEESQTQSNRHKQGKGRNTSSGNLESLQSSMDEEVIGIITMEDVMEELLQVSSYSDQVTCEKFNLIHQFEITIFPKPYTISIYEN